MATKLKILNAPRASSLAQVATHNGGRVYWVKGTAAADYSEFYAENFIKFANGNSSVANTISQAVAAATANVGDVIYVAEGYTETRTAALTLSKAGVAIIGLGSGRSVPTLTANFAGDCVNITAANVVFSGFHFAAPTTDAATAMINVAAAGAIVENITGIGSGGSENYVDCITLASGADDLTLRNIRLWNSVVAVNSFLSIEAAIARLTIQGFRAFGEVATAGIIDAAAATQMMWDDIVVAVTGTSKPAATLDSNPTGVINRARFSGTSTTLATNAALGTGLRLFDVLVLEETDGSAQGALIPAVDAN